MGLPFLLSTRGLVDLFGISGNMKLSTLGTGRFSIIYLVSCMAIGCVLSENSEPVGSNDSVAGAPNPVFQMPDIHRIEISVPESSEPSLDETSGPGQESGPMSAAMPSNIPDHGDSQSKELLESLAADPAAISVTEPFSDIYHRPDQIVVNRDGLPQFAPSPYAPATTSHTWSGPAPSPEAKEAQFEAYSVAIKGYSKQATKSGKTLGHGTLQIRSKNGTLVYQSAFSAPLVPKPVLQQKLDIQKIIASGQFETVRDPTWWMCITK